MAKVKAYRCSHSGGYYPEDYIKEWGRKYGIGLGSVPVSECLDTDYHTKLDTSVPSSMLMHSVGVTRAQLDFCEVDEEEYKANLLIPAIEDPSYQKRKEIIREKQLKKSAHLKRALAV